LSERVDVKVGFSCNNRCRFCVQGDKRKRYPDKPTPEVKALLEDARKDADSIVFTGGEFTIRKDAVELVRFASSLGFRRIQVQTNGRMLAYRAFCEDLIAAGANEFSPALHGPLAEIHEYLTRSRGSFSQTVKGIENLVDLGQKVLTNTVVVRSNYRHLPDLASLFIDLGVDQYQLAFVHPAGAAGDNFYSIVPRLTLVEPYLTEAIEKGLAANVSVMTEAVPYCFLPGYEDCAAELYIPRTKIFDADNVLEDYTQYRLTEGKVHGPACKDCLWMGICEGPWREYVEGYGADELVPRKDDPGEHGYKARRA